MNYLLTDFTTERWKSTNMDSVQSALNKLENVIKENRLMGEFGTPELDIIALHKVSHRITNVTFVDGKIYGDVEILPTAYGKILQLIIDTQKPSTLKFYIRAIGSQDSESGIEIDTIITWDIPSDNFEINDIHDLGTI